MEALGPIIVGLGALYIAQKQKNESFQNKNKHSIPNVDIPNKNYPDETVSNAEKDLTSYLSTNNAFEIGSQGVYTDKYFNQSMNTEKTDVSSQNKYTSLTGQKVDIDYYRHNNMQPFFGSKSHTGGKIDALESTLDAYQGAGSNHISKKEISPMFEPGTNVQHAFGTPNQTDFIRSRINPSLKMSNVKPFEDIKVGPGLGLGYNDVASGGFNSGMMARDMWREKTVDELRVANKQKSTGLSALGYEGPAYNSQRTERANQGIQEKNRVDTFYELGPDRLFTTTGIVKAPTYRSIEIDKETARQETSTEYVGGASTSSNMQYVKGEYMDSHRQTLDAPNFTPAYAKNSGNPMTGNYSVDSFTSQPNNRTYSNNDNYYGIVGSAIGSTVAPLLDILRPSRKENVIGTLRPYQNAKSSVEKSYIFNPNDQAPPTIRQSTEHSKFHLNVNGNQNGGAYRVTPQQPVRNERDTTTDVFYMGGSGATEGHRGQRSYEAEYNQRNNMKKIAEGRLVPGNMSLMNRDVNYSMNQTRDQLLQNNRATTGLVGGQIPSSETFGKIQGSQQLYQGQQLDRNNGDVLQQLKKNPYTLSVLNGL